MNAGSWTCGGCGTHLTDVYEIDPGEFIVPCDTCQRMWVLDGDRLVEIPGF